MEGKQAGDTGSIPLAFRNFSEGGPLPSKQQIVLLSF
jgi:hypothetical protein